MICQKRLRNGHDLTQASFRVLTPAASGCRTITIGSYPEEGAAVNIDTPPPSRHPATHVSRIAFVAVVLSALNHYGDEVLRVYEV